MARRFFTSDPFLAVSEAAKRGLRVGRYPSGQYMSGMVAGEGHNNWFGYGVLTEWDGFLQIEWAEVRPCS